MPRLYGQRNDGHRDVLLTFDDGPSPKTTPRLLDTLARYEVKALFFVVGRLVATPQGKEIVHRAQAEGHIIGNHTFNHPNLRGLPLGEVRDEISRTHDAVCECTGGCNLFRPPYGSSSSVVSGVLQDLGYETVLWNVDTLDWKLKKDGQWVEHGMEQVKLREDPIVLMHDIHATTVDNVERLIKRIRQVQGARFTLY